MPKSIKTKVTLLIVIFVISVVASTGGVLMWNAFQYEYHNNKLFMQALGLLMLAITIGIPVRHMAKRAWQKTKAVRESLTETTGEMLAFKKGVRQER